MTKLLENPWLSAPVGVLVYLMCTVLCWQTPKITLPHKITAISESIGPSWDFNNPEADQLLAELRVEKKSLDSREQQLDELAERLKAERSELGQVTLSVRQLQSEFDKSVIRIKDDEVGNLKKLAKVYGDMSPETAATVLSQMDNEAIVRIFVFLKENETAAILEALAKKGPAEARRTAELSEQLRLTTHSKTAK
jgi:flagellar motility protein MotE (MotC chaperone)